MKCLSALFALFLCGCTHLLTGYEHGYSSSEDRATNELVVQATQSGKSGVGYIEARFDKSNNNTAVSAMRGLHLFEHKAALMVGAHTYVHNANTQRSWWNPAAEIRYLGKYITAGYYYEYALGDNIQSMRADLCTNSSPRFRLSFGRESGGNYSTSLAIIFNIWTFGANK